MNNLKKLYIIALSSIALAQGSLYAAAEPILDNDMSCLLHQTIQDSNINDLQDLLASGVSVNSKDSTGQSLLHIAASYGKAKVMRLLLNARADFNQPDKNGWTPLFYAVQSGNTETIETLLAIPLVKDRINHQDHDGKTPLHIAAMNGHTEMVSLLLKAGADVHICDNDYMPAAFYSTRNMHDTTTQTIMSAAMDHLPVLTYFLNNTRLYAYKAIREGNIKQLSIILFNYGLDPNQKEDPRSTDGRTLLHDAAESGASQAIPVLIAAGAYVNSRTEERETPLDLAVQHGKHDCVQCLLQANEIEVNLQDNLGNTSLHRAIRNDDLTSVQLLLNTLRIDLAIKNDYLAHSVISTTQRGMTTLDLALLYKRNKITQLLNNYASYKTILPFLEAQHPRLGANSVTHNLDTNCIRNIYEWLTKLAKNR